MRRLIFYVAIFAVSVSKLALAQIPIPIDITVQELLPDDVAALSRVSEAVTFGVPLKYSDGITSTDELGLSGASDYQFRTLNKYPNGNIQWVLIDTIATVSAGGSTQLQLTNGSGNSTGVDLATDNGSTITVATGGATFTIKKTNFNVFDSVDVGGTVMVGNTGAITATDGVTLYSSANDSSSSAVIEENGPVKAVVKCDGHLKPIGGDWLFGYTMRMYFYKNTGRTRLDLIIKNAEHSSFSVKVFESLRIEIPTTISTPSYLFTLNGAETSGIVETSAHIYQGYSSHKYSQYLGEVDILQATLVPDDGVEIVNGINTIHTLGLDTDYSDGYAAIYEPGKRINCGIRNLYGMWPTGFTMDDQGNLGIDFYSTYNSKNDAHFAFYGYDKRQIVLDFTTSDKSPKDSFYAIQYPLSGRTSFQHYKDAKAVYYNDRMADYTETRNFLSEIGLSDYEISNVDTLRRYYVWGQGGGPNQYDLQMCKYLHYMQTGNGGAFLAAQNDDHHKAFGSTRHSDDFDFYTEGPTLFSNINDIEPIDQGLCFNRKFYDREHTHDISSPIGYFLTGDESIIEAWNDWGEYTLYDEGSGKGDTDSYYDGTTYVGFVRTFSRALRRAGAFSLYSIESFRDIWLEKTGRMAANQLSLRDDPSDAIKDGWNLDRGYVYQHSHGNPTPTPGDKRTNTVFMTEGIFVDSLWYYKPQSFKNRAFYEDYEDLITGLAYHTLVELVPNPNGQNYTYTLDETMPTDNLGQYPLSGVLAFGYEKTGNENFLTSYVSLYNAMLTSQTKERVYSPYSSRFIHNYYNRNISIGYVAPFGTGRVDIGNSTSGNISRNGSQYTITWMAPVDGIGTYQVKFSPVPMVENLNFNQVSRTYEYDPAAYDNFWAALNVNNEPTPKQTTGEAESTTVDVQQSIADYNSRYNLSPGDDAYQTYDAGTDYYFAVKYIVGDIPPQPPIVVVTDNPSPIGNTETTATISGTATPFADRTISSVDLVSGTGTISGTTNWAVSCTGLEVGDNDYIVRATDSSGESADLNFTVTREGVSGSPTVTITTQQQTVPYSTTLINITGTTTNSTSATCDPTVTNTGTVDAFVFENVPLNVGENIITVTASDGVANATDTVTITREAAPSGGTSFKGAILRGVTIP